MCISKREKLFVFAKLSIKYLCLSVLMDEIELMRERMKERRKRIAAEYNFFDKLTW